MIEFSHLSKRLGDKPVLQDLSFAVPRGAVYGLLGPNGCGKSTAIHILCNLLDADGGQVRIDGQPATAQQRRRIGYAPQEIALYRDLPVRDNLRFFGKLYGLRGAALQRRVDDVLALFGLGPLAHSRVGTLSGGWQRRANVAAALVHAPDVLVLDEPTAALDIQARHDLWQLIETLRQQGLTLLLTTHHFDEAQRLCTHVGIMQAGRIHAQGSVADLLRQVPAAQIAQMDADDQAAVAQRAHTQGWACRHYAGRLAVLLPQAWPLAEVLQHFDGLALSSIALLPVTLEHAYQEVLNPPGAANAPQPA